MIFSGMPLSPPEWWWHTKCGMLALPMSSVKHYKFETGALIFVLFLLGIFWSALDSYLPWYIIIIVGNFLWIYVCFLCVSGIWLLYWELQF